MSIRNSFLTLTALSFLLLALVLSGIWYLSERIDMFYQVGEQRFNANILVQELRGSSEELTRQVRIFAVSGSPEAEKLYWNVVSTRNGESPRPSSSLIAPGQKRVLRDLLMENGITPEEYAKVDEANRLSDALVVLETEAMNAVKGLFKDDKGEFTIQREPDRAYATQLVYSADYANSVAAIMRPMDDFTRMVAERNGSLYDKTIGEATLAEQLLGIAVILTLLMLGVMGWYSTRKVASPLDATAAFALAVSSGNLQSSIDDAGNNEIFTLRKSLNQLVSNLRQRITEAEQTSAQARGKEEEAHKAMEQARDALQTIELSAKRSEGVAVNLETLMSQARNASHELAQHINAAGMGSEQQALRVTETATAMEEMNSTTMVVASNAKDAVSMSMQAQEKAKEGSRDMGILVRQIGQMQEQTISMTNDMHELSRNADGITQVMTVISDIADQTNLLALNAAIEAARAGEAGRGFAVVADEVRKLAEKTMQATGEVGNTIKGIQAGTHKNVHNMNQSVESIESATKMAKASGAKLEEIVHLVEEATGQVQLITEAAIQQQQASEEITKAIVTVQDISQETLENMRQATGNVDALNHQISDLHNLTEQLRQK